MNRRMKVLQTHNMLESYASIVCFSLSVRYINISNRIKKEYPNVHSGHLSTLFFLAITVCCGALRSEVTSDTLLNNAVAGVETNGYHHHIVHAGQHLI